MIVRRDAEERKQVRNLFSDKELWQLTNSEEASMHSYFDLNPWSPDGRKIVFCSYDQNRTYMSVYWMGAREGAPQRVKTTRFANTHVGLTQQWMDEGERVVYSDRNEEGAFFQVVDLQTGGRSRLHGGVRMLHPQGGPAVSATSITDRVRLAQRETEGVFLTDPATGKRSLLVSLQDALDLHPDRKEIESCTLFISHTKWSPDGSQLFFVYTNERYAAEEPTTVKSIYAVNADGTNLRLVCSYPKFNHPNWHPDGKHILLNRQNEQEERQLTMMDAATGLMTIVTDRTEGRGHPSFSPDGNYIIIDRYTLTWGQSGFREMLLYDVRCDTVERVFAFPLLDHSHQGTHIHPVWSRDSSSILFNSDQTGHSELYLLRI